MSVSAGDGIIAVFKGEIDGVLHNIVSQYPVKSFPFFGIFSNVYRPGSQLDPQPVQQPECFHKNPAAGHNGVEIVSMSDQKAVSDGVLTLKYYFSKILRRITIIMIAPNPHDFPIERNLPDPIENSLVGCFHFCIGTVDHIAV